MLLPSLARDAHTRAIQNAQLYGFQIRAFEDGYQAILEGGIDSLSFQRVSVHLNDIQNLIRLDLQSGSITDVSPLSGLTNLQTLILVESPVSDVRPLSGLTNLKFLYLNDTQVSNVSPLSGLTNLQRLDLSGTQVSDVRPLSGLEGLRIIR